MRPEQWRHMTENSSRQEEVEDEEEELEHQEEEDQDATPGRVQERLMLYLGINNDSSHKASAKNNAKVVKPSAGLHGGGMRIGTIDLRNSYLESDQTNGSIEDHHTNQIQSQKKDSTPQPLIQSKIAKGMGYVSNNIFAHARKEQANYQVVQKVQSSQVATIAAKRQSQQVLNLNCSPRGTVHGSAPETAPNILQGYQHHLQKIPIMRMSVEVSSINPESSHSQIMRKTHQVNHGSSNKQLNKSITTSNAAPHVMKSKIVSQTQHQITPSASKHDLNVAGGVSPIQNPLRGNMIVHSTRQQHNDASPNAFTKQPKMYASPSTQQLYTQQAQQQHRQGLEKNKSQGFLAQASSKVAAVSSFEQDLLISQLDKHGNLNLAAYLGQKNAYTRSEVFDILREVHTKVVLELERQVSQEKLKTQEYKETATLLDKQLQKQVETQKQIHKNIQEARELYSRHEEVFKKMEECQMELKQTMLNSLMSLDFYKDLETYISENRYSCKSNEVLKHLGSIDGLIQQHGLHSLDFDTDRIQRLVDSIQDYIQDREIQQKVIQINIGLEEELNQMQPENQIINDLKVVRVTKVSPFINPSKNSAKPSKKQHHQQHTELQRSSSHSNLNLNRHLGGMCCNNFTVPLKNTTAMDELKVKNAMINRLREQLEHKMKKIMELKQMIRDGVGVSVVPTQAGQQYKEALVRLERDYNIVVIKNTKLTLEQKQIKRESEELSLQISKLRNQCKELSRDNEELRRALNGREGYKDLEETVVQISSILVSKKNEQLTQCQKQQLRSIFGHSSILQWLRQRILQCEENIGKITNFLSRSLKLNVQSMDVIEYLWNIINRVVGIELSWKTPEQMLRFRSKEIDTKVNELNEIRKLVLQEQVLEQHMIGDEKAKLALVKLMNNSPSQKLQRHNSGVESHNTSSVWSGITSLKQEFTKLNNNNQPSVKEDPASQIPRTTEDSYLSSVTKIKKTNIETTKLLATADSKKQKQERHASTEVTNNERDIGAPHVFDFDLLQHQHDDDEEAFFGMGFKGSNHKVPPVQTSLIHYSQREENQGESKLHRDLNHGQAIKITQINFKQLQQSSSYSILPASIPLYSQRKTMDDGGSLEKQQQPQFMNEAESQLLLDEGLSGIGAAPHLYDQRGTVATKTMTKKILRDKLKRQKLQNSELRAQIANLQLELGALRQEEKGKQPGTDDEDDELLVEPDQKVERQTEGVVDNSELVNMIILQAEALEQVLLQKSKKRDCMGNQGLQHMRIVK